MRFTNEQLDGINEIVSYEFKKYFTFSNIFELSARREEYVGALNRVSALFNSEFHEKVSTYSPLALEFGNNLEDSIITILNQVHELALSTKIIDLQEFTKKSEYFLDDFWEYIQSEGYDYDGKELENKWLNI